MTVSIDGTPQTTGYTVNAVDGSVTFTTAPTPSSSVIRSPIRGTAADNATKLTIPPSVVGLA